MEVSTSHHGYARKKKGERVTNVLDQWWFRIFSNEKNKARHIFWQAICACSFVSRERGARCHTPLFIPGFRGTLCNKRNTDPEPIAAVVTYARASVLGERSQRSQRNGLSRVALNTDNVIPRSGMAQRN